MKKLKTSHIQNIFIVFISLLLPILLIVYFRQDFFAIEKRIPTTGIAGPLFSILLMGILSATPIPTDPIVIFNGAIFGPTTGILVSWMGNNLAAVIEYYIGKAIGQITNFDPNKKRLPFGLEKFPADSIAFLIFGRFVPQVGGKVVSLTGGVYKVAFLRYLWTAMVSNLFGSIILSIGGYAVLHNLFN